MSLRTRSTPTTDGAQQLLSEPRFELMPFDSFGEQIEHLPDGARMLPNPEGVAPGAVVESVYVMPGVPTEMKGMFETVIEEFEGDPAYVEEVRTSEPESALLDRIEAVREAFDVTVGSYPGEEVRLKVMAADAETAAAAAAWLRDRVDA